MIRRNLVRLMAIVLLAVGVPLGMSASPASAAVQWIDGVFAQSQVINCPSMIFGAPYLEPGLITYVGYEGDPVAQTPNPSVGQTFWVHVVIAAAGNSCGGQYAQPALSLPAGLAVAGAAQCVYTSPTRGISNVGCNAVTGQNGALYFNDGTTNTVWPLPTGGIIEFNVPVRANVRVIDTLRADIGVADGNDNPTLKPTAAEYVLPTDNGGARATQIVYPTPSTTITPGNPATHESRAYVVAPSAGTVRFYVSLASGSYPNPPLVASLPYGGTWLESVAWTPVTPGTTYYWKVCFTPIGRSQTCGAEQSFKAIGSDAVAPTLDSITVLGPRSGSLAKPITARTVTFRLTFSEPVEGVINRLTESVAGVDLSGQPTTTVSPTTGLARVHTVTIASGVGVGTRGIGVIAGSGVTDSSGNALAAGRSIKVHVSRATVDTLAPRISTTALPLVSLRAFTQKWTASDGGGLGYFTVTTRDTSTAGVDGVWGSPVALGAAVRSQGIAVAPGSTRCVRVVASDKNGNSATGTVRCTTTPSDDSTIGSTGTWTRLPASSLYFRSTLSRSTQVGATKFIVGAKVKRIVVVVQKRPGSGTIEVRVNGAVIETHSLARSSTANRQMIVVTLPTLLTGATVDVRVKSSGSSGVRVDGLGVILY